jgi:hypothetical protein
MALAPPPSSAAGGMPGLAPDDLNEDRLAKVRDTRTQFIERLRQARPDVLRSQLENCFFYLGLQWLAPLPDGRGFMRANLRRDVPRPVTNRYKAILDAIDAPLSRLEPSLICVPGSDKDDDRMTADLATRVLDYLSHMTEQDRFKGELSKILVCCNNAYAHLGFDPTLGPTMKVPQFACAECGKSYPADQAEDAGGQCPDCGGPLAPSETQSDVITEGGLFLEAVTPFETWVDYAIPRMEDQPIVMIRRMRPRAWAEQHWPEHAAAIKQLPALASSADLGLTFLQSLIRLAPGGSPTMGGIGFGAPVRWDQAILDDLLYVKPCTDYPDGLYLRMLGDELVVEDLPLGQIANDGTAEEPGVPFIPVVHYGYDNVPGTHVHTGPADHLKDLQRQRNRREAAIELYFQRSANGIWLIPEGTDVQTPSGEEGMVLRYSPLGSGGAKPERMEGSRLPSSFVEWLRFTDEQMQEISGAYDIFKGDRPPNVSSGYAMQILTERAQSRFAHLYGNYEVAHAALGKAMFLLFRNHAPDEIYFKIKGEEARWTVLAIKRADLRGGIDIRVEAGSARPRTSLEKKAAVEQAMAMQLIDLADPDVRLKILHLYGIPELMSAARADDEQIAREHATLIAWARSLTDPETGEPDPTLTPEELMLPVLVDALLDNHALHLQRHRTFMLTPEFLALPDWVRQAFRDGHYVEHLYEQAMSLQQQAMMPAPPVVNPGGEVSPQGGQAAPTAMAGPQRAQGQQASMQNGGKPPGPGQQAMQPNVGAMQPE